MVSEYETYLNQFAASGRYDLIIGIGFDQADAMEEVAGRFSDQIEELEEIRAKIISGEIEIPEELDD